jgi:FkbH-like protein
MIKEIKLFNTAINTFLDRSTNLKKTKLRTVFFLRNEQVENFAEKINNYSALSKLKFKFFFSGYDNNLPILKVKNYDISILWLDYNQYKINREFFDWIKSKANDLSGFSDYVLIKPIIIPNKQREKIIELNKKFKKIFKNEKVIFLDIIDEMLENYKEIWDLKRSDFFGTKTSAYGQDLQSKLIGLKVFPSLFNQKIKSIIFDLDDTLYTGVVGEDGIEKIYLDINQKKATKIYSSLQKNGTLLSICSKNNNDDVKEIFKKKLLKKDIFFPIKANWEVKSKNIQEIQKTLKISYHNMLFIDNNISEIIEVKKKIPDINVFWSYDSQSFINCLKYYPNIVDYFNLNSRETDIRRIKDLKASLKRKKLLNSPKYENHLSILKMKIEYRLNNKKELDRIFSLTNKVNQFIFTYKRFSKSEIIEYINNPNKFVFTIALQDKFSNSGNVGVIFFSIIDNILYLDDLCVSCRALGRNLEDYFIFYPIKILLKKFKFDSLVIKFIPGPKNKPAKKYFFELQRKVFKISTKNKFKIPLSKIKTIPIQNKDISISFKN